MFLVLTKRNDVFLRWADLLTARRGDLQRRTSLSEALELSESTCISLTVIDSDLIAASLDSGELQKLAKRSRTLLINADLAPQRELHVLSFGIAGCCASGLSQSELEKIVDVVLKGGIWVSRTALPSLFRQLGASRAQPAQPSASADSDNPLGRLTPREREVAMLVSEGANNKTIAQQLRISDVTIKTHLSAIFRKLGVSSRTQMAIKLAGKTTHQPPAP